MTGTFCAKFVGNLCKCVSYLNTRGGVTGSNSTQAKIEWLFNDIISIERYHVAHDMR
jgi:hypothetical protein